MGIGMGQGSENAGNKQATMDGIHWSGLLAQAAKRPGALGLKEEETEEPVEFLPPYKLAPGRREGPALVSLRYRHETGIAGPESSEKLAERTRA